MRSVYEYVTTRTHKMQKRNNCEFYFHFLYIEYAEWWRNADVHSRTGTTFFPPLLGISPLFAPPVQNHDSTAFHTRTPGKSARGSLEKGKLWMRHAHSILSGTGRGECVCMHKIIVILYISLGFPIQLKCVHRPRTNGNFNILSLNTS